MAWTCGAGWEERMLAQNRDPAERLDPGRRSLIGGFGDNRCNEIGNSRLVLLRLEVGPAENFAEADRGAL